MLKEKTLFRGELALPFAVLNTPSSRRQWSSATCRVASSARLVRRRNIRDLKRPVCVF